MTAESVAVVLVTFNRLEKLKIALDCYNKQTHPITKIIVVDNGSSDGTVEFLRSWKNEKCNISLDVLVLKENTGGAGGFGAGMDYAINQIENKELNADWVLVSDDDAFPEPNAIEELFCFYNKNTVEEQRKIVSLCSSVINNGEVHTAHRSKIIRSLYRIRFVGVDVDAYKKDSFEIDLFSYVGTMIKVSALKKAGTTNKELFIYGDDNEHSIRLGKLGKLICVPKSRFIHNTPGVETRKVGWHNYYNRRNQIYILKEYFPKRYYIARVVKRYLLDIVINTTYTREEKRLFLTAYKDGVNCKLGKHPTYKPGFNF